MTDVKKLLASAQHRPYTAYNIFFQLEREFILQSILGVTPSVDVAFDQAKDDVIPMLPQKYREIILSYDWYIPGKTQRKKRKHRKSHGKISFSDLSKRVAVSWHNADEEVKLFCFEVSDMLMQQYKKALQKQENEEDSLLQQQGAKKEPAIRPNTRMSSQVASLFSSSTTSATIDTASIAQPYITQLKPAAKTRQGNVGDSEMSSDEDYEQKTSTHSSHRVSGASLKDDDAESSGISNSRTNIDERSRSEHKSESSNSLPSVGQLSLPLPSQHHYNYFSGYKST